MSLGFYASDPGFAVDGDDLFYVEVRNKQSFDVVVINQNVVD